MTVNINRNVTDAYYRYKMPIVQLQLRANKTYVINLASVSKALDRPPNYILKHFGYELGARVSGTKVLRANVVHAADNDVYYVGGAHSFDAIDTLLNAFITNFVLCAWCTNPETKLVVDDRQQLARRCMACGRTSDINGNAKLRKYIVARLVAAKRATKRDQSRHNTNRKSAYKLEGAEETELRKVPAVNNSDDDDWCLDTSKTAVRERLRELDDVTVRT